MQHLEFQEGERKNNKITWNSSYLADEKMFSVKTETFNFAYKRNTFNNNPLHNLLTISNLSHKTSNNKFSLWQRHIQPTSTAFTSFVYSDCQSLF